MNTQDFDRLIHSIREDVPGAAEADAAAARVRARLNGQGGDAQAERLEGCADFRTLFGPYRENTLTDARRLLLEDHLHTCVACRRAYQAPAERVLPIAHKRSALRRGIPWAMAAVALVAVGVGSFALLDKVADKALAPSGARATVASVNGQLYRISDQLLAPLSSGAAVNEGDEVRTGKDSHAVLRLRDGSMVEMAERSDLSLSERWHGKTVRLDRGEIMVEAAKQRVGRLEVRTADCLVSVKGTIFSVSHGIKGSRVSVVEGAVEVDQAGATEMLHRGDQAATSPAMASVPLGRDVAWSQNAAKYLALLGEFRDIQHKIDQIPAPALRYSSNLAGLLPQNTMIYAAIPNLGSTLDEANQLFEQRVQESEVLSEWWNQKESQQLRSLVDRARTFSGYLGNEVVVGVAQNAQGRLGEPVLLAEARNPDLKGLIEQQISAMQPTRGGSLPMLIEDPRTPAAAASHGPLIMVHGNIAAVGTDLATLSSVAATADRGGSGAFLSTPFWQRISQSYQSGAGWVFAANMEQIIGNHVKESEHMPAAIEKGLGNVNYLVIERKPNLGRTENVATLSFNGQRSGLAGWLGAPAPMGALDFVSPNATFAASFVVQSPGTLLTQFLEMVQSQVNGASAVNALEQLTGINFISDVADTLGGEATIAIDGPLLPTPSWKVALEVTNPTLLQSSIQKAVTAGGAYAPKYKVTLTTQAVNGLTYYTISSPQAPAQVDYTFTDGYLLAASSTALLTSSIQNRAAGLTLANSAAFRALLPQDAYTNFSALAYYNVGAAVAPLVDQLKSSGILTPSQQQSTALLAANREPTLIYAYGQPDSIKVASRGSFFGLNLDTLIGLNGGGMNPLGSLFAPVMNLRGAGHASTPRK